MKSIKKSHPGKTTGLIALLAIFALASCATDLPYGGDTPPPNAQLVFNIGIAANPRSAESSAGAGNGNTRLVAHPDFSTTFTNGDQIGLFAVKRAAGQPGNGTLTPTGNHFHNVKVTYHNGAWTPETPLFHPGTGYLLDFFAYFPYTDNQGSPHTLNPHAIPFNVPIDQSTEAGFHAGHYLGSEAAGIQQGATVNLVFWHQTAMVQVEITGAHPADPLTVALRGVHTDATFGVGTTNAAPLLHGDLTSIQMHRVEINDRIVYRALVPAQTPATGTSLFHIAHNREEEWNAPALAAPLPLAVGTVSRLTIALSALPAEINGTRWATRNLDMPNTFAEHPHSAGRFYQWGTLGGETHHWHTTGAVTGWNSYWFRDAWTTDNHPCPAGWRLPNQAEITALNNAGSTWHANWNNTGVSGRVFPADATVAQITGALPTAIFLPAVGFRGTNGGLGAQGTMGYYWSSTGTGSPLYHIAWSLEFSGTGSSVPAHRRDIGFSVRCVKE